MQIQTERGLISVDAEYQTAEGAIADGYHYMFTSKEIGSDIYGKALDDEGHRYSFALFTGFC